MDIFVPEITSCNFALQRHS